MHAKRYRARYPIYSRSRRRAVAQLPSGEVLLTPEIVSRLFPELVSWVTLLEEEILQKGQPPLSENRRDAEAIGVQQIDAVRAVVVDNLPVPSHSELRLLAVQTGLITPKTAGMTFGHGVVLKNGTYDRWVVAHELTHVRQYEGLDGIEPFLKEYVKEISYLLRMGVDHWRWRRHGPQIRHWVVRKLSL